MTKILKYKKEIFFKRENTNLYDIFALLHKSEKL